MKSSRVFDYDRDTYDLDSLKLDPEVTEDRGSCITKSPGIASFKVLGKGGFGSIFVGTICKRTEPLFDGDPSFRHLGLYHGVLLAAPRSNQQNVSVAALEKETVTPITVAVKRIDVVVDPEQLDGLMREANNLKVLWAHRNFVTIYGLTQSHDLGCLCLVMDLVRGCNLNQFLRSRGTTAFEHLDEESESLCRLWRSNDVSWWMEKLRLFREIVIGLIVCHREQVYHGDLKGTNILLDKSLVPKMVDFGMSFRGTDNLYLKDLGGSLFWAAPEIVDELEDRMLVLQKVEANPYPSDVYSLGMVLAEILLDGEIPESFTGVNFMADKCLGGCPVPLDEVKTADPFFNEKVVDRLKVLIDKCCEAERENRIPLGECLSELDEIYSNLSESFFHPTHASTQYEKTDHAFSKTTAYGDMVCRFKENFPHVADYMVFNPSKNMVMDKEENLLVHYFCKLDYAEGVKYILEKSAWGFEPERELPYLSLLCVTEESLKTLQYFAASWPQMMKKQLLLLHKACMCNNEEVFRLLLLDVGMNFDTWEEFTLVGGVDSEPEGTKQKPIHKLAARGKTEMVRLILDNCDIDPDYVNTVVPEVFDETPLYYAVQGDHVETMNFLLERGGGLVMESVKLYHSSIYGYGRGRLLGTLFAFAIIGGHLKAAVALYERRWGLVNPVFHSGNPGFVHTRCLKEHINNVAHLTPSISPLQAACRRGNEDVLEAILYLLVKVTGVNLPVSGVQSLKHIFTKLLFYIARSGSKEMLDLVIGHGFNVDAAMKLKVDEVQQLLLDEDSHENAQDKTLFNGDTLLKNILIASDGHYMTLENVAQWSDNKELFDYLVDLQLKQEVVSSGNESQATGLESQSKQLYQEKSASEGEAYAQRILSGFGTGSAPEEVISIHYNIDFPHELSVECCKRGYLGILQFLEDCGLNLSPNPQVLWDLHITAVQYGHINVADFLLERGFSVNSSDGSSAGWSPLQWACQSSHMDSRKKKEMVSFLLKKGADPNYTSNGGYTSMDIASGLQTKGSRELVKLLLQAGFNIGKKNRWGEDYSSMVTRM